MAPHALRLSYVAACLVARGVLDHHALQHPRNLLLQGAGPPEEAALLACFVARGAAALPPQLRQQWLTEALDAAQVRCVSAPLACRSSRSCCCCPPSFKGPAC